MITHMMEDFRYWLKGRIPLALQDALQPWRKARFERKALQAGPDAVVIGMGRDRQLAHPTWYRGDNVNYQPTKVNMHEPDALHDYILKGWLPEKPFITREHFITAFGSCFAAHITNYLADNGYNIFGGDLTLDSYVVRCGEGMVNTFAVAQQFEWAFGERTLDAQLWHDKKGNAVGYDESVRQQTRDIFERTDVFIITLGLSEVWYDKLNGDVFWRAIPRSEYDPERHGFKVSSVAENLANLETVYRIVRAHRPDATIVFTLSPVPLVATFRPVSCITANSVSKAVLRVAADEFYRAHEGDGHLFYFPSYEIVKEYFKDPYEKDNRHIRKSVVNTIMRTFDKHFLVP